MLNYSNNKTRSLSLKRLGMEEDGDEQAQGWTKERR